MTNCEHVISRKRISYILCLVKLIDILYPKYCVLGEIIDIPVAGVIRNHGLSGRLMMRTIDSIINGNNEILGLLQDFVGEKYGDVRKRMDNIAGEHRIVVYRPEARIAMVIDMSRIAVFLDENDRIVSVDIC